MKIVIYENNRDFRNKLEQIIYRFIDQNYKSNEIVLSTGDIQKIYDYINNSKSLTLYFLDIKDENKKVVGLSIAEYIRKKNEIDPIVFFTGYLSEIIYSTLHKTLSFNLISKHSKKFDEEIQETIIRANRLIHDDMHLTINRNFGEIYKISFSDIYFIEAVKNRHKIRIFYKNDILECSGLLSQ